MELEFLNEFMIPLVCGICLCIGYMVKHYSNINNKYIPLIVALVGVIVNVWVNEFLFTPQILLGGMVSGLGSTGLHQAFKQLLKIDYEEI